MSNVELVYNRLNEINKLAEEKGGSGGDAFLILQSDGVTVSFFCYFCETPKRDLENEIEKIYEDLNMVKYALNNFELI